MPWASSSSWMKTAFRGGDVDRPAPHEERDRAAGAEAHVEDEVVERAGEVVVAGGAAGAEDLAAGGDEDLGRGLQRQLGAVGEDVGPGAADDAEGAAALVDGV